MDYQIIKLKTAWNKDPKLGGLTFVEGERDIPFAIRRIYCIYKTEEKQHRGFHAHKENWQLLFCPFGSIDIILTDGEEKDTVTLDDPSKGLVLTPGLWREMVWRRDDSVLCVAASEYYDPDEYIRDYHEFLAYRRQLKNTKISNGGGYYLSNTGNVHEVKRLLFPFVFPEGEAHEGHNERSRSIVIRGMRDVPFEINRIFYIFGEGNVGTVRGKHANRKSEFVLFNISGSCRVKVIDVDLSETVFELSKPYESVYLPRMIWKEMYDFTPDSVLMAVTNEYYDDLEYIRDFQAFACELRAIREDAGVGDTDITK